MRRWREADEQKPGGRFPKVGERLAPIRLLAKRGALFRRHARAGLAQPRAARAVDDSGLKLVPAVHDGCFYTEGVRSPTRLPKLRTRLTSGSASLRHGGRPATTSIFRDPARPPHRLRPREPERGGPRGG